MSRLLAFASRPALHLAFASLAICTLVATTALRPAFADDDPPSRVGRLAVIDGTVSFHTADQTTWGAASQNYPITTGNALWADNGAHAAVQIGANDINLGSQTELDIDQLTDQTFQASLPQGSVYLNLRGLNQGDHYQIATPRGTVSITQPGRYEISSGDQTHPSTVTVLEGAAQVSGDNNINLPVGAGQSGVLSDNGQGGPVQANLAAANGQDDVIAWAQSREPQAAPPPPEAAAMTGTQDLARYGSWNNSPDYGAVWYPQVQADWVPYRSGHWAWVAPWGWTWVDDAPWGFAPFHYGRWVQIGPRWAWAPRPVVVAEPVVPVYAPALVSFVGDIGGIGIGISIGGPSVGWVPLAPREVYYPPYRCSPRYARNVNVTYVKNVNIINVRNTTVINNTTVNRFTNHGAVTVVSRDAMARSQHVPGAIQHVDQRDLDKMRGFKGDHAPFAPTAQTAGLTPNEAKHYGVSPQQIQHTASAGPAIKENNGRNWHGNTAVGNSKAGNEPGVKTPNASPQAVGQPNNQFGNQTGKFSNQNKWANQGSHKPGAPVTGKPSLLTTNGQGGTGQQPGNETQGKNLPLGAPQGQQVTNTHDQSKTSGQTPVGQTPATIGASQTGNGQTGNSQAGNGQKQHNWNWATNKQSRQPGAPVQAQDHNWRQNKQPVAAPATTASQAVQQQNQSKHQQQETQGLTQQGNAALQQQVQQQTKQRNDLERSQQQQLKQQQLNQQQLQAQQLHQQQAQQRQQVEQQLRQQKLQQQQVHQQQQQVHQQQEQQQVQQRQTQERQVQERANQQRQAQQAQQAAQQQGKKQPQLPVQQQPQ